MLETEFLREIVVMFTWHWAQNWIWSGNGRLSLQHKCTVIIRSVT